MSGVFPRNLPAMRTTHVKYLPSKHSIYYLKCWKVTEIYSVPDLVILQVSEKIEKQVGNF